MLLLVDQREREIESGFGPHLVHRQLEQQLDAVAPVDVSQRRSAGGGAEDDEVDEVDAGAGFAAERTTAPPPRAILQ